MLQERTAMSESALGSYDTSYEYSSEWNLGWKLEGRSLRLKLLRKDTGMLVEMVMVTLISIEFSA